MFAAGDTVGAAELLQNWRSRCPSNARLRILLSTILLRTRLHPQEAEDAAGEAVQIEPDSLLARLQYAVALMSNNKTEQAAREYERVVQLDPSSWEGWSGLGKLYDDLHDEQKARQAQAKAAILEPGAQTSRMRQLRSMLSSGHPINLDIELKRIINSRDTPPETLTIIAEQALAVGDFEAAQMAAEKALQLYPDSLGALKTRCLAQFIRGDATGALDGCNTILDRDPAAAQAYAIRSLSEGMLAKVELSGDDAEKARQLEPRSNTTLFAVAERAFREGQYKVAAASVQTELDNQPPLPAAHLIQAKMFLKEQKWDDAIAEAREMARFPGMQADAAAIESRARLHDGLKDDQAKATDLAVKASELSPDSAQALLAQAAIALADERTGAVHARLDELIERQPGNADAIFMLSEAARMTGDSAEQKRLLERCLAVSSGDPDACAALSAICLKDGDVDRAIALARKTLVVREESPQALYALAQGLEQKGNKDESIKFYKLCLSSGGKGAEAEGATEALKRLGSSIDQP
jgi:tetratricopeptide (TPR) repeat protein